MKKIILASQSPRRKQLLKKLRIDFSAVSPKYDEKIDTDIFSTELIENIAKQKALSVLNSVSQCIVISADTVVVCENKILGKPKDKTQAIKMLEFLSGKTHRVVTAVNIIDSDTKKALTVSVTSYVTFNTLSRRMIEDYIEKCNPLDKAGSYGIQELDNRFVKEINGSFDNIVGLPSETVAIMLKEFE